MDEPQYQRGKAAAPTGFLPGLLAPLNELATPLLKLGVANPLLLSPGATVLEVAGRKSGRIYSIPLTCYLAWPVLVIGTVRPQSQWIRNLAATDDANVWLWGRRWTVRKQSVSDHVAILQVLAPSK